MTPSQEKNRQRRLAFAEFIKLYPFTTDDLDGEEWRPIEGHPSYQVSNFGRVKSLKNCRGCKSRILRPTVNNNNYLITQLFKNAQSKWYLIHRLVAKAFIPNPNNKPQVNHRDGCKINACASNLEWATNAENIQHAYDTGLEKAGRGEENYLAKFTNEQVRYIRNNFNDLSTVKLAKMFNVTDDTISRIQIGRTYKNAGGTIREKRGVPESVREKIRSEYLKGRKGHGIHILGRKYNLSSSTIRRIVNEK